MRDNTDRRSFRVLRSLPPAPAGKVVRVRVEFLDDAGAVICKLSREVPLGTASADRAALAVRELMELAQKK